MCIFFFYLYILSTSTITNDDNKLYIFIGNFGTLREKSATPNYGCERFFTSALFIGIRYVLSTLTPCKYYG